MKSLTDLPNIGVTLAQKLEQVGICTPQQLIETGSENALIRISTLENNGVCINMLYALEGAIEGIRWHGLSKNKKEKLKEFYRIFANA